MRVPKHIGIIPDGNRRWAVNNNLSKEKGYDYGVNPGLQLFKLCQKEIIKACVESVMLLTKEDCEILVVGDSTANYFPKELIPFTKERKKFGKGGIKANFLIHYGWSWDLKSTPLKSKDISRIDLIIRWGGRRRLSGFLPVQSVYADFYVIDSMWPDFKEEDFYDALNWYDKQDVTLGG